MRSALTLGVKTSLNRTSVGLKLREPEPIREPQEGLNRTSVGLKPALRARFASWRRPPQSNQRGIETLIWSPTRNVAYPASIEPAWD